MNKESTFDSHESRNPVRHDRGAIEEPIRLEPDTAEDRSDEPDEDEIQLDESDVIDESIAFRDSRAPKLAWTEESTKLPAPEEQCNREDYTIEPKTESRSELHFESVSESADYLAEVIESGEASTSEVATNPPAAKNLHECAESADGIGLSNETISDESVSDDGLKVREPEAVARPVEPNRPEALPLPDQDHQEIQRKIARRRTKQVSMLDIMGLTTLVALTIAAARYVPLGIYMLLLGLEPIPELNQF